MKLPYAGRFTSRPPSANPAASPRLLFASRPALGAPVQPVAVTDRKIYIYTRYHDQLWAATLPAPHQRSGH